MNDSKSSDKKDKLIAKAWTIINMVEELPEIPKEIKSAIKTWKFMQGKA